MLRSIKYTLWRHTFIQILTSARWRREVVFALVSVAIRWGLTNACVLPVTSRIPTLACARYAHKMVTYCQQRFMNYFILVFVVVVVVVVVVVFIGCWRMRTWNGQLLRSRRTLCEHSRRFQVWDGHVSSRLPPFHASLSKQQASFLSSIIC